MIRWAFAALVLANIGLLMWASWYRESPGGIAARPVFHPEQMVPISTPGVSLRTKRNERNDAPLAAAKPRPRCVSIGPFLSADTVEAVAVSLAGDKFEVVRRTETQQVENSYWVHLAPFATRPEAEKRLKELERLGVRDLLIMPDAQGAIAISLGLFSQADNAQGRLQELSEKGITARREIRYRSDTRTWFDLRLPEPADKAVGRLKTRHWGAPEIEVRDAPCPAESGSG